MAEGGEDARRRAAVTDYRKKLLTCRELEARVKTGNTPPPPHPLPPVSPCVVVPVGLRGSVSSCWRAVIARGGSGFNGTLGRWDRVLAASVWV
jgi:hypothetical protein